MLWKYHIWSAVAATMICCPDPLSEPSCWQITLGCETSLGIATAEENPLTQGHTLFLGQPKKTQVLCPNSGQPWKAKHVSKPLWGQQKPWMRQYSPSDQSSFFSFLPQVLILRKEYLCFSHAYLPFRIFLQNSTWNRWGKVFE